MYLKEAMLIASFFICVQAVVQVASVVVSLTCTVGYETAFTKG